MSNIVYSSIVETFPVANQNNDTVGFRNNFASIKTALNVANTEITELQRSHVFSETSPSAGECEIDASVGEYFKIVVGETTAFTITNWPVIDTNPAYSELTLEIVSDLPAEARTVSFPDTLNVSSITYTITSNKTSIFRIWKSSTNTFVHRLGQYS
jgi:hypothetical protein